jgi:predicted DNA-binding protein
MTTEAKGRKKRPLYLMLPPIEFDRLKAFADRIDRPLSWVCRDALGAYLSAVEADAGKLQSIRAKVDARRIGQTQTFSPGRPRKPKPVEG